MRSVRTLRQIPTSVTVSDFYVFRDSYEMTKSILLLRLSYWIAAIADLILAILVWIPERMGVTETVYPMGLASAVAFSWGVLLLIADRKPLERRWILIPTILVVALITLAITKF